MKCKIAIILTLVMLFMVGCSHEVELTVFQEFEKYLDEKGLSYEKETMAAEMVGAIQGIKYESTDIQVEIYRFDKTSAEYMDSEETQSLYIEGFGAAEAVVENGYAIISDNSEFVDVFRTIVQEK